MNYRNISTEPLRSLPREMSVKYSKESSNYFVNNNESVSKERNSQNNYYIKKPHTSLKGLPPEKSFNDSLGTISSGPLAIVRGLDNRNSGGSSSVATPNSPQQSPLSLCSSSGGKSSDNQLYEDGLSEEDLRQIAIRQQRQIQLQIDDLRQKQQQITHLKQQIDKKSKSAKVNPSILKLKEVYDQQEQKITSLRSAKNQVAQSRINLGALKTDIGNIQNIMNNKKHELKKLESRNEELREYIQFVHQRCNSSNLVPPDFETFIRHKNSSVTNVYKPSTVHSPDPTIHGYQSRGVLDSHQGGTYTDHTRIYVRHPTTHTPENNSNPHFSHSAASEISAFMTPNPSYRSKPPDSAGMSRAPPLPAHSYQRSGVHISEKSLSQPYMDSNLPVHQSKDKRPPLPSYSDATLISANNKISMLLSQASRSNAHTPTSSPPVLRRSSIVGLPYGKMPSRFASRNTINNVYIKKSSQESLEKYKKTASEMYKAQLSKFKSSSADDIRTEANEIVLNTAEIVVEGDPEEDCIQEDQSPSIHGPEVMAVESMEHENGSICSSCSSLSLPEDLKEDATVHVVVAEESVASVATISVCETTLDNSTMTMEVEEFDSLLWDKSIKRALDALTREPEKKILKKVASNPSQPSHKRKAYFHPHSLLLDAALEAEFELVKEMSSKVDNISEATDEGITALHNAVCSGREDIVKFLLDLGAHVNAGDTDGWTPLHCAASCNNIVMARLLVEYGASLFATSISDSEIPLQKCEADDDTECEQYLLAQQDSLGLLNEGKVYSLFHYDPQNEDELQMYPNQELVIIDKEPANESGWFLAVLLEDSKKEGFIPKAYVSCYRLTFPKKMEDSSSSQCAQILSQEAISIQ